MSDDDDGWSDEETTNLPPPPKILGTYRVKEDYLPPTNDHLTLIQDDLVYVFKKTGAGLPEGFWEGETLGVTGIFPFKYVEENKTLDQEIAAGKAKRVGQK
eukprot:CAMPEP_0168583604 /NCGR_PEP_ID=MMETSP0420-20121227/2664_1 /TAXON_ID=498008 /ORGANISM="Pessonella sp." /LENGTH=100 /DNA_ID=CAMNT_0008618289 /DNA_START=18 /DNA_END=320 /DNA_ORIENTATION=-